MYDWFYNIKWLVFLSKNIQKTYFKSNTVSRFKITMYILKQSSKHTERAQIQNLPKFNQEHVECVKYSRSDIL